MPAPPHSSGMATPMRPRSASLATISLGNRWFRSISAALGRTSLVAKSRAVSRIISARGSAPGPSRSLYPDLAGCLRQHRHLPPFVLRRALLEEGFHPLLLVGGGEEAREQVPLELVGLIERQVGAAA